MQPKWWMIIGGLVAALAGPLPAGAAQVDDLFQAEVGVKDLALVRPGDSPSLPAGEAARRQALMRAGLGRILVRLSGTTQVVNDPMVQRRLLDRAESFVARYQYLGEGDDGPRIRVHFTGKAIRSALWESGWPVWGRYRPSLLVWVARRGEGGLELVSADSHPDLFTALRETARREALPVLLPMMDGQDRRQLTGQDLLFEEWDRIRSASQRYDPQGILLLRLDSGDGSGVRVEWTLRRDGDRRSFQSAGESQAEAVGAGLRQVLAKLAQDYAVFPGKSVALEAVVHGISDLGAFARVERGLARLAAVESVRPGRIAGDVARFRLAFRGRPEEAGHILELLDLLRQRAAPAEEPAPEAEPAPGGQMAPKEYPSRLHFTYRP
jgi:hypothetical protein